MKWYLALQHAVMKRPRIATGGALVFVVLVGVAGYLWWTPPANTFYLREDGFHPESILIESGETITFVNKSSHAFWPASNGHPQHDLYASFDVGRPVLPGDSWSFTFDREGRWGFHDHIRSFYTGTVFVGADSVTYDCLAHISELDTAKKGECWDEKLQETLHNDGAEAAFKQFAEFYASDPGVTQIGCHLMVHRLGDAAYGEYVRYGNDLSRLQFPPESVYCGYGYYHGIMEHMIRDHPDFKKADAFCKMLVEKYQDTVPRIESNCYHAIGHGFIPEPTDIETWGDPHALPAPAIAACRNIEDSGLRAECMQGAFNVVSDWMWNNQFGLRFPKEDSLSLCRTFDDDEVSKACYYELSMKVLPYAGDNLINVYQRFVTSIPNDAIAGMVMNSAAAGLVGVMIQQDDFVPYLKQCRSLPERVQVDCLKGLAGGFVAHGKPEREYEKAMTFCGDEALTVAEKNVCYSTIFRNFRGVYTPEKTAGLCELIDVTYHPYCTEEI